jgi:ribosomal protein S18 acetylase RimI-like enzyme
MKEKRKKESPMLSLRPFTKSDAPFLLEVYHEAFPAEERMEDALMLSLSEGGSLLHLLIERDGAPVGFFTLSGTECAYLYYFAIHKDCRGQSIGGGALSLLFAYFAPRPVAVDLERLCDSAPNALQRRRRRAFYLKSGFRERGIFVSYLGMELEILTRGEVSLEAIRRALLSSGVPDLDPVFTLLPTE